MTVYIYEDLEQGSDEWFEARRGLMTASEMKFLVTPAKLELAKNEKVKMHVYELAAQRISGYVEPSYIGEEMMRGWDDEIDALEIYADNYAEVQDVGFITNDKWGFTIGYSPDSLVGEDGQVEAKSRRQKFQIQTITEGVPPKEHLIQLQTGLLVSERKWCDYISYSAGLPMYTIRVWPDEKIQTAILEAATSFEKQIEEKMQSFKTKLVSEKEKLIPTERREEGEIEV